MKQSIQVVMLPTEDKSHLHLKGNGKLFTYVNSVKGTNKLMGSPKLSDHRVAQHVYITVSQDVEPIKEGDWHIFNGSVLAQATSRHGELGNPFNRRKIIATTDPKLTVETELNAYYRNGIGGAKKIPQLPQSFLKEFVANPEGKWEVEYEFKRVECHNYNGEHLGKDCSCKSGDFRDVYELKLNQDNTVNITSVKEKMYNREEVTILFNKLNSDFEIYSNYKTTLEDWIKKNL